MRSFRLFDLCREFSLCVKGEDVEIKELNLSNREVETDSVLTYCASRKYIPKENAIAPFKAIIVSESLVERVQSTYPNVTCVISQSPEATFYKMFIHLYENGYYNKDNKSLMPNDVIVGKGSVVEEGVVLGKGVHIGCNSTIRKGTIIGDNVVIGSNTVIGEDDLQAIMDEEGNNMIIPHVGGVKIGNGVRIGSCCTISRSLFSGYTQVGDHTLIGDFSHVAHNCSIGKNVVMTLGVILSGSSYLKDNAWMGPNSTINNKIIVGEGAKVGIASLAVRNIPDGTTVFGVPGVEF